MRRVTLARGLQRVHVCVHSVRPQTGRIVHGWIFLAAESFPFPSPVPWEMSLLCFCVSAAAHLCQVSLFATIFACLVSVPTLISFVSQASAALALLIRPCIANVHRLW